MPRSAVLRSRAASCAIFCALALASTNGFAQADDTYFETVRGARDDGCRGRRFVCYDLLSTHRRNYFLTGLEHNTEVKFQFSVKYDLWPNESPSSVHLAYTQKSIWNLYLPSAPFDESNYHPEIFYTYRFDSHGSDVAQSPTPRPRAGRGPGEPAPMFPPPDLTPKAARCRLSYLRGGVEHESNGQSGATSRGWNRFYVSGLGGCDLTGTVYGTAGLEVWAPPFGISDNSDISQYMGSGELTLALGASSDTWLGSAEVSATGRKGWRRALDVGSVEVDARWRPGYARLSEHWRFVPYLMAQMFTGYGEMLLDYDHPSTSIRVGIGLSGSVRLPK